MKPRLPYPRRSWWRLWALQASWNRRTMQGPGWLFALAPWLGGPAPEARARRSRLDGFANTNPYVAGLALGVVMRLEDEGEAEFAGEAAESLSRSLGALGDAFFWSGLRPFLTLTAGGLAIWWGPAPIVAAWLGFLAFQAYVRWWSLERGYRLGRDVVHLLQSPRIHRAIGWMRRLAWLAAVLVAGAVLAGSPRAGVSVGAVALGAFGAWRRLDGTVLLVAGGLLLWLVSRWGGL